MATASRVIGTGHYVPEKVVTNFDVMKMMETTDEFIVKRTGVRTRRHAEADISATAIANDTPYDRNSWLLGCRTDLPRLLSRSFSYRQARTNAPGISRSANR